MVRDDITLDPPVAYRGKVVARCPHSRDQFLAKQIALARETLEGHVTITKIFVPDNIEIVLSSRHRQICAPPVLHTLVFDVAARLEAADLIRAAAERRLKGRPPEGASGIIGAGKEREPGKKGRQDPRLLCLQRGDPRRSGPRP